MNVQSKNLTLVEQRLERAGGALAGKRRDLAERIVAMAEESIFLSARKLAKRLDVDPATIVRTVQALGYAGYADFIDELKEHFVMRVTPFAVLQKSSSDGLGMHEHIAMSLDSDVSALATARAQIDLRQAEFIARRLCSARRIIVAGEGLIHTVAHWFAYSLSFIGLNAEAPAEGTLVAYKARVMTSEDVLVAISFRRCFRSTIEAQIIARERGAWIVGLTDSQLSPVAKRADSTLIAGCEGPNVAGSLVAPLGLLNSLVVACSHVREEVTLDLLKPTASEYASGDRWWHED